MRKIMLITLCLACFLLCRCNPITNQTSMSASESTGSGIEKMTDSSQQSISSENMDSINEMRNILGEIPYTDFDSSFYKARAYPFVTDEIGKQLADFIAGIVHFNPITTNEVSSEYILRASIFATKTLQWTSNEADYYYPELSKLQSLGLQFGYEAIPRHHVDITAKKLFGDDITITDYSINGFITYYEELEAFSVSGFGMPAYSVPVILSYNEFADFYEVIVAFMPHSGVDFVDENMQAIPDTQLKEIVELQQKYKICIGKTNNGNLYYITHSELMPDFQIDEDNADIDSAELTWGIGEPFGQTIEYAAKALYEIYNDPDYQAVHYTVGLADYNLDGIPELIVGDHGNWGGFHWVFRVEQGAYEYLGRYWVTNGERQFYTVKCPDTNKEYFVVYSSGGHGFDYYSNTTFFVYDADKLETWSIKKGELLDNDYKVYTEYKEISHNGEVVNNDETLQIFYEEWGNNEWTWLSGPGIEEIEDWHGHENPTAAEQQIYSLAKEYLALEIREPVNQPATLGDETIS